MLHEVGIASYYVSINTARGSVTPDVIVAIKLPDAVDDPSLVATMRDPKLGQLLFFDPTDELTPFGQIAGNLQANYGLLVTPNGGELVALPTQPSAMNGIQRKGKLVLDAAGNLKGDVNEVRVGDRAWAQRWALHTVTKDSDRIKPIESLLASSPSNFRITKASVTNLALTDLLFGFDYSFQVENYAKNAGNLLLVRSRVLGKQDSIAAGNERGPQISHRIRGTRPWQRRVCNCPAARIRGGRCAAAGRRRLWFRQLSLQD